MGTKDETVYGWGRNKHNVLGANIREPEDLLESRVPLLLDTGCQMDGAVPYEVACGTYHSIILKKSRDQPGGHVLASGLGNRGRLGIKNPDLEALDETPWCSLAGEALDDTPRTRLTWSWDVAEASESSFIATPRTSMGVWISPFDHGFGKPRPMILRVACGADHTLCLATTGVVYAWGLNSEGQCGVGRDGDVWEPTPVAELPRPRGHRHLGEELRTSYLAAGARHSMLVAGITGKEVDGGLLYMWGCADRRQLGLGRDKAANQFKPCLLETGPADVQWTLAAGGEAHTGAVGINGSYRSQLWTWGAGSYGRLGSSDLCEDVPMPRLVDALDGLTILQLAFGTFHSVVLTRSAQLGQQLFAWGCGEATGLLAEGDKSTVTRPRPVPIRRSDSQGSRGSTITQISAGPYHTSILFQNGTLCCFGLGACGRLGTGDCKDRSNGALGIVRSGPMRSLGFALQPDSAADHGVADVDDQPFVPFSAFQHDTERADRVQPEEEDADEAEEEGHHVLHQPWEVRQLGVGDLHTVALTHGGQVYVWGSGDHGQLGLKLRSEVAWTPKLLRMPGGTKVREIAVGNEHCLARSQHRLLFAWGKGEQGQLGISRDEAVFEPTLIPDVLDVMQCSAGDEHSGAIVRRKSSESDSVYRLYMWGSLDLGKLGLGRGRDLEGGIARPTEVDLGGNEPIKLVCGQFHTAVITGSRKPGGNLQRAFGDLWTFGGGMYGRLGHDNQDNAYEPRRVKELDGKLVSDVALGAFHSCALTRGKTLTKKALAPEQGGYFWMWGKSTMVCESEHVLVPKTFSLFGENASVLKIVTGDRHTLALTSNGETYAWGENSRGQLGIGSAGKLVRFPEMVKSLPGRPEHLATGPFHTVIALTCKDTVAWGDQSCGRLGLTVQEGASEKEKADARIVTQPLKVKAEWASIEAMTALLCPRGQTTAGGGRGKDKAKAAAQTECMIEAIHRGQHVTSFTAMQILLKIEPADARLHALISKEDIVIKKLEGFFNAVSMLPDMERTVTELQKDLEHSFCANLGVLNRGLEHDFAKMGNGVISSSLGSYEELLWLLQQQVAYLVTLSERLAAPKDVHTFLKSLEFLFEELDDSRTLHNFVTLMKMMIDKEVTRVKCLEDLFCFDCSIFFRVFQDFATRPTHYDQVVHRLMDAQKETVLGRIVEATRIDIVFALSKQEFLNSPISEELKKMPYHDVNSAFNEAMYNFAEFVRIDLLSVLDQRCRELHPNILKMFASVMLAVRRRQPSSSDSEWFKRWDVSQDEHMHEPLLKLFVLGIVVPLLRSANFFGGAAVGLGGRLGELDGSELLEWNIRVVKDFFEKMVTDTFSEDEENIARTIADESARPAMLKLMAELAAGSEDDTDTELIVSLFTSHFDRSQHTLRVPTSQLMKLSNLLKEHQAALDLTDEVSLDEVLAELQVWDARTIKQAEADDVTHNFPVNSRFLFKEQSVTLCRSSRCLVPPRACFTGIDSRVVAGAAGIVKRVPGEARSGEPETKIEELLRSIGPVKASTFHELQTELNEVIEEFRRKQPTDFVSVAKTADVVAMIGELIKLDHNPADLLDLMSQRYLERNRHMHYLKRMGEGLTRIQGAQEQHAKQLKEAEEELRKACTFSLSLELPDKMKNAARKDRPLAFPAIEKRLKYCKGLSRQDRLTLGLSYRPTKTYTLRQLRDQYVIKTVLLNGLELENPSNVELTFTVAESGVQIDVSLKRRHNRKMITSGVKNIKVSDARLRELQRLDQHQLVILPTEGMPVFKCNRGALLSLISKLAKS